MIYIIYIRKWYPRRPYHLGPLAPLVQGILGLLGSFKSHDSLGAIHAEQRISFILVSYEFHSHCPGIFGVFPFILMQSYLLKMFKSGMYVEPRIDSDGLSSFCGGETWQESFMSCTGCGLCHWTWFDLDGSSLPLELLNHIQRCLWTLRLCAQWTHHPDTVELRAQYRHFQDQWTATPDFAASYELQ